MSGIIIEAGKDHDIVNYRVQYELQLTYGNIGDKDLEKIIVCGVITQRYDDKIHKNINDLVGKPARDYLPKERKLITYLQGGPGFPCKFPGSGDSIVKVLLDRGYQIFWLDQRGTGYSTAIESRLLVEKFGGSTEEIVEYVLKFRADSIVQDCEQIRKDLLNDGKWSLLGQSYGGFCIFTYLSMFPDSIKEALITGGVPPVGHTPQDVYTATYARTTERNVHYYRKYPQDVEKVATIAKYLSDHVVELPNGGILSVERFQTLGLNFGHNGGTDEIHLIILKLHYDLQQASKRPAYLTLATIENMYSFDTNIIYALFQEAIYCEDDIKSEWSADLLRYHPNNVNYQYNPSANTPLYFTGEMVFKSMYKDYSELKCLEKVADALHKKHDWSQLYHVDTLRLLTWEKVPIVAATYVYDQYVDFDVTRAVKQQVFQGNGNLRQYITSEFFHNGIRANAEKVLGSLFDLLECEID